MTCSTGKVICCSISSGPERRRDGVDLHLHRRRVGEGVDVELAQRHDARDRGGQRDAAITRKRCRSEKSMIQFSTDDHSVHAPS